MDEPLTKKGAAQLLQDTFDLIGGTAAFARWAQDNPDKFYPIWSKLVPASLQVKETRDIQVTVSWLRPNRLSYKDQHEIQDLPHTPVH